MRSKNAFDDEDGDEGRPSVARNVQDMLRRSGMPDDARVTIDPRGGRSGSSPPIPPPLPPHGHPNAPPYAKHVHEGGRCPACGLRKK